MKLIIMLSILGAITIANIVACILIKKKGFKIFFGTMASIIFFIGSMYGMFMYNINYKIHDIDTSKSPDGKYEICFKQVGDPDWPFGYTHVRLVLKKDHETIEQDNFDIADDGANSSKDNWQVTWQQDKVTVIINGSEQEDAQYDYIL